MSLQNLVGTSAPKKIFRPPAPNSAQAPCPPPPPKGTPPPLSLDFQLQERTLPFPSASDSPFPSPEQEKSKISETSWLSKAPDPYFLNFTSISLNSPQIPLNFPLVFLKFHKSDFTPNFLGTKGVWSFDMKNVHLENLCGKGRCNLGIYEKRKKLGP